MEYIVSLNDITYIDKLEQLGIQYFVCGMQDFSCRQATSLNYQQLTTITNKEGRNIFVAMNTLIEEKYIDDALIHLQKLIECNVDGIFFQDFGVINMAKQLGFQGKLIYAPDTLNTNYATLNVLHGLGVDMAFLAREISLKQKLEIVENTNLPMIMQVHGVEYMAYSKRHLLQNYYQHHKKIEKGNQFIQASGVDYRCHVYEDKYGTHILSEKQMECLSIDKDVQDIPYGYIESLYMTPEHLYQVVQCYKMEDKQVAYKIMKALDPTINYYHSFLFDETVYRMEDVRKREADEKSI